MSSHPAMEPVFVGIDVGGPAKGFHAVALNAVGIEGKLNTRDPSELARWCNSIGAHVVAVDAPGRWRAEVGAARLAERQLAAAGISCFSTPSEARARGHAFYTWMLAGAALYEALQPHFPLMDRPIARKRQCLETFPQAVACALAGKIISARQKRRERPRLVAACGVPVDQLEGIDEIDAALCAIAAQRFLRGEFTAYGDPVGGYLVVPAFPVPAGSYNKPRAGLTAPTRPGRPW